MEKVMKCYNIFTADLANTYAKITFCVIKNNKSEFSDILKFSSQVCDAVSHLEDMVYLAIGTEKTGMLSIIN